MEEIPLVVGKKSYSRFLFPEFKLIVCLALVQFVNVLEFMMFMPLGPDLSKAMAIPASSLGVLGGLYTLAASASGLACSTFLDRFDRKKALSMAMGGLAFGTFMGAIASTPTVLFFSRIVSGIFGGPAAALTFAIIGDVVPVERRGKAVSYLMMSFSMASILGVPAGLELARIGGWQFPFLVVTAMVVGIALGIWWLIPSLTSHLQTEYKQEPLRLSFFYQSKVWASIGAMVLLMVSGFLVVPNISAFVQLNMHYPREHLARLYFIGGGVNLLVLRLWGTIVDLYGSTKLALAGTLVMIAVVYALFAAPTPLLSAEAFFIIFMMSQSMRGVAQNTLATRIPNPQERARFMSAQSAAQHFAGAVGAFLSSKILFDHPDGTLGGTSLLAMVSIAFAIAMPLLMRHAEKNIR